MCEPHSTHAKHEIIWGHALPGKIDTLRFNLEVILTGNCKCELIAMQLNEHARKNIKLQNMSRYR